MSDQSDPNATKTIADVLSELKVRVDEGLTNSIVIERQKAYGLNADLPYLHFSFLSFIFETFE